MRPPPGAEERVADHDHHVADGRRRARRALHGVAAIQEVVGREILEQVAERALNQQRGDHRDGDVALGVLGLAAHRGDRFESDQDQNGDRGLHEHPAPVVRTRSPKLRSDALRKLPLSSVVGIADRGTARACRRRPAWAAARRLASRTMVSVTVPLAACLRGGKLVGVGVARGGVELAGHAARRMVHAVAERHHREDQQAPRSE